MSTWEPKSHFHMIESMSRAIKKEMLQWAHHLNCARTGKSLLAANKPHLNPINSKIKLVTNLAGKHIYEAMVGA